VPLSELKYDTGLGDYWVGVTDQFGCARNKAATANGPDQTLRQLKRRDRAADRTGKSVSVRRH